MSAHTPGTHGPWKAVVTRDGAKIITVSRFEPTGRAVAWVGADDTKERGGRIIEVMSEDAKANANLIAAAPDLLAALNEIYAAAVEQFGYHDPRTERARAAIAKAEGRTP